MTQETKDSVPNFIAPPPVEPMTIFDVAERLEKCGRMDAAYELLMLQSNKRPLKIGDDFDLRPKDNLKYEEDWLIGSLVWKKHYLGKEFWESAYRDLKLYNSMDEDHNGECDWPTFDERNLVGIGKTGDDGESWRDYFWYPRYNGDKKFELNPIMLKNTGWRCGHEHDCCGCTFSDGLEIVKYDYIHDGWILAQTVARNI